MSFKSELRESSNPSTPELFFILMSEALDKKLSLTLSKHINNEAKQVLLVKIYDTQKPMKPAVYSSFGEEEYYEYLKARDYISNITEYGAPLKESTRYWRG